MQRLDALSSVSVRLVFYVLVLALKRHAREHHEGRIVLVFIGKHEVVIDIGYD